MATSNAQGKRLLHLKIEQRARRRCEAGTEAWQRGHLQQHSGGAYKQEQGEQRGGKRKTNNVDKAAAPQQRGSRTERLGRPNAHQQPQQGHPAALGQGRAEGETAGGQAAKEKRPERRERKKITETNSVARNNTRTRQTTIAFASAATSFARTPPDSPQQRLLLCPWPPWRRFPRTARAKRAKGRRGAKVRTACATNSFAFLSLPLFSLSLSATFPTAVSSATSLCYSTLVTLCSTFYPSLPPSPPARCRTTA